MQPPIDLSAYPSPLAGFRNYVNKSNGLANETLMTIKGLPRGTPVRFATMDTYDGLAWGVSNGPAGSSGAFQKVGQEIPNGAPGRTVTVHVDVRAYSDVWVPDVGATNSIQFGGPDASVLADAYRYNLDTGTAVVPTGLNRGDTYTLHATISPPPTKAALAGAEPTSAPASIQGMPPAVPVKAKQWSSTASPSPYARLNAVATSLRRGGYSDGESGDSLPGHGEKRLVDFLSVGSPTQLVGDDEQYAATFALMADSLGYPARVVLGAKPEPNGVVKGRDVHAWVEVNLSGVGWIPFDVTPSKNHPVKKPPPPIVNPKQAHNHVPPAAPAPPPPSQASAHTGKSSTRKGGSRSSSFLSAVLGVVVAVLGVARPAGGGYRGDPCANPWREGASSTPPQAAR